MVGLNPCQAEWASVEGELPGDGDWGGLWGCQCSGSERRTEDGDEAKDQGAECSFGCSVGGFVQKCWHNDLGKVRYGQYTDPQ